MQYIKNKTFMIKWLKCTHIWVTCNPLCWIIRLGMEPFGLQSTYWNIVFVPLCEMVCPGPCDTRQARPEGKLLLSPSFSQTFLDYIYHLEVEIGQKEPKSRSFKTHSRRRTSQRLQKLWNPEGFLRSTTAWFMVMVTMLISATAKSSMRRNSLLASMPRKTLDLGASPSPLTRSRKSRRKSRRWCKTMSTSPQSRNRGRSTRSLTAGIAITRRRSLVLVIHIPPPWLPLAPLFLTWNDTHLRMLLLSQK